MSNKELEYILDGNPIIFPTDTVYGLGVIPTKEAIKKLYSLKKRDENKKIIALVSDIEIISKITDEIDYNLVEKFLPGPLSIVCKTNKNFYDIFGSTIGIRIPNNDLAREIIRKSGGILMTTSANISGENSVKDFNKLSKELLKKVKVIFKTDKILSGIPSTVISYIDGKYELLREGQIKFNDILKTGGNNL